MGRIAGVTAAETRERLLRAAADVFAERGYDGTRVADIAAAAGVSNGALYAHFASKADLLVDALRTHGRRLLADLFAADPNRSITELLLAIGRWLPRRRDPRGYLIVEALVAARRDQDVARPMRDYIGERADWLAELVRVAQAGGELDPVLSPNALAHFCLLLAMGSALVPPDLHAVGDEEWAALLTRLVAALSPARRHGRPDGTDKEHRGEGPDRRRALPGARPLLRPAPPTCSARTTRVTGRCSATASCRRAKSATRAWRRPTAPSARSTCSRRTDMTADDRFTEDFRETARRRGPRARSARSSPARSPTGRPTSPTSSRSGPPTPTRSRTTCGSAARSRTPSGSAAAGCRRATRTSRRSPTTPSASPRGRSS